MQQTCAHQWCGQGFEITDDDRIFYDKISPTFNGKKFPVPPPSLCPRCREQRRLGQFNRHFMYKRPSAKTGDEIISIFSPDKTRPVFENDVWWSDQWDPLEYGRDVDLAKPVLPQMQALFDEVPVMALVNDQNENSPYINSSGWSKNCHWSWGVDYCEHVFYSESTFSSTDCIDCLFLEKGQHCYECTDCVECHSLRFSQNCKNCHESAFLYDCIGCGNCYGCVSLRQQQYCYFNEQLTKEAYEEKMKQHIPFTIDGIRADRDRLRTLRLTLPHCYMNGTSNESVSGDYLYNSKNAHMCFDSYGLQDCTYCCNTRGASDSRDVSFWGHPGELLYECMAVGEAATRVLFCYLVWGGTENMLYCNTCISCKNCFGCAGLRHKQYCIFNTQYTKEDYEKKVADIIEAMQKSGEWGQFFSMQHAPFCYNESLGQIFYPMTKQEVTARGWQWFDAAKEKPNVTKIIPADQLPQSIAEVPDDIVHWAIACEKTGRPFKIEKKELELYRLHHIPAPRIHPEQRLWNRWKLRNPRELYDRACAKCTKPISTSFSPDRREIVYCERCYLEAVY